MDAEKIKRMQIIFSITIFFYTEERYETAIEHNPEMNKRKIRQ